MQLLEQLDKMLPRELSTTGSLLEASCPKSVTIHVGHNRVAEPHQKRQRRGASINNKHGINIWSSRTAELSGIGIADAMADNDGGGGDN